MFVRRETFNQFIHSYPIVSTLISLNTIVFLLLHIPFFPDDTLLNQLIGYNLFIKEGQLWRLITPLFLHSALTHFIFNIFSLIIFGPAIEKMLRPARFLTLFFLCGIGANLVTFFVKPLSYSHLGASGAIFGFLGFYLYIVFQKSHLLSRQDATMIKTITIMAFILTFIQPHVNIVAHLSGCAIGFILAYLFMRKTYYLFA